MTDAPAPRRLAELYRAAYAESPAVASEDLLAAIEGRGEREQRFERLSQAAANPLQSDLMRTVAGLGADVDILTAGLRAERAPRVSRKRPVWAALAASVALVAVVGFGLRPAGESLAIGTPPGVTVAADSDAVSGDLVRPDLISAVSFEAGEPDRNSALFGGGFDS
jgi:hypothetical protein